MFFSRVFVTIWVVSQLQGVHIVVSTTAPGSAGQPRASIQPQSLVVTNAKSWRDQHSVKTSLRSFVETLCKLQLKEKVCLYFFHFHIEGDRSHSAATKFDF